MLRREAYCAIIVLASILGSVGPGVGQDRGALGPLAEKACGSATVGTLHSDLISLMGSPNITHSVLIARESDNSRFLYLPDDACKKGQAVQGDQIKIIFANFVDKKIGVYFVTTLQGQLSQVVQVIRGPNPVFTLVESTSPMSARFDAEKEHWIRKYGLSGR